MNNLPIETALVPYTSCQPSQTEYPQTTLTYHHYLTTYTTHKETWMTGESLQHTEPEMVLRISGEHPARQTREPPQPYITYLTSDHNHPKEINAPPEITNYSVETPRIPPTKNDEHENGKQYGTQPMHEKNDT